MSHKSTLYKAKALKALRGFFKSADSDHHNLLDSDGIIMAQIDPFVDSKTFKDLGISLHNKVAIDNEGKAFVYNYSFAGKSDVANDEAARILRARVRGSGIKTHVSALRLVGPLIVDDAGIIDKDVFKSYDEMDVSTKAMMSEAQYNKLVEDIAGQTLRNNNLEAPELSDFS